MPRSINVSLVGDVGVGKTQLISVYLEGKYNENYVATTYGDDVFKKKNVIARWDLGQVFDCEIFDSSGQEKFKPIRSVIYNMVAHIIIVAVDLNKTEAELREQVERWVDELLENSPSDGYRPLCFLAGTKADLITDPELHAAKLDQLKSMAKEFSFADWIETSAKTGLAVNELFQRAFTSALMQYSEPKMAAISSQSADNTIPTCITMVMIGDTKVGKSSLLNRYSSPSFNVNLEYRPTIGGDYITKQLNVGGEECTLKVWDTPTQEQYKSYYTSRCYKGANVMIIAVDLTEPGVGLPAIIRTVFRASTLKQEVEKEKKIVEMVEEKRVLIGYADPVFILVGTKMDLLNPGQVLEAQQYLAETTKQLGFATSFLTSALHRTNVEELFQAAAALAVDRLKVAPPIQMQSSPAPSGAASSSITPINSVVISQTLFQPVPIASACASSSIQTQFSIPSS